ncbi:hypothetical protein B296_00031559 [Ensete ventricosum]|uniref:Uncharacterized protein n=1 Tax=Ensete ventricosum TaxID=4639 RepID=A0A426Y6C7_ENSVE|nr:hypothetical protein B296_00031559 [Ensete ventricosum]
MWSGAHREFTKGRSGLDDVVGSSPRVHPRLTGFRQCGRELTESPLKFGQGSDDVVWSLPRKTETHRKIVGGSRKAYRDSDDVVGSRRKFARRFAEGIEKLAENAKGDRRKEDRKTCHKIVGGCQSMRELGLH